MTINTKELNEYQLENYNKELAFSNEIKEYGYNTEVIINDSNPLTLIDSKYYIRKQYQGEYTVALYPYPSYPHVSHYTQRDIRKLDTSNKVKTLTKKKIDQLIAIENDYHAQMAKLEEEYTQKHIDFLQSIKNLPVTYTKDYNNNINGGEITKNGIEFTFLLNQDGYIQKDIKIHYNYKVNNDIDTFLKLSDNKYNQ